MASSVRLKRILPTNALILVAVFFIGCFPRGVQAQASAVTLVPGSTKISFTLGATFHTVHGTLLLKSGVIRFDPGTGAASGSVIVDATSAETGNDSRDKNMHANILESQKFPEIVFTPRQVKGSVATQGKSEVEVVGTFRLHGQDHEMTMPVTVERDASGRLQADTHFAVPYVRWGLKNPSTFVLHVSDTVQLEIQATAQIGAEAAP
jgi:polyisoprenoid-binding protein YceI